MPQNLEIEIGGVCIAEMKTSHRDGTHYDIFWNSNKGYQEIFPNFDTGVECQPSDPIEQQKDFKNDFTHTRRAIAAASLTAKQFLDNLKIQIKTRMTILMKFKYFCVQIILTEAESPYPPMKIKKQN